LQIPQHVQLKAYMQEAAAHKKQVAMQQFRNVKAPEPNKQAPAPNKQQQNMINSTKNPENTKGSSSI
jgi:hypothetical protein